MVWCGVEWSGVEWGGVSGVEWSGVAHTQDVVQIHKCAITKDVFVYGSPLVMVSPLYHRSRWYLSPPQGSGFSGEGARGGQGRLPWRLACTSVSAVRPSECWFGMGAGGAWGALLPRDTYVA